MPRDYIPSNDLEFVAWLQNFITVATEFQTELGLTPAQLQEIAEGTAEFNNSIGIMNTKHNEALASTRQRDAARTYIERLARMTTDSAKRGPGVNDTILIALNLNISSGERSRQEAQTPTHLLAELGNDGKVHLDWDAGGNTYGTQYIIERRAGKSTSGEFTFIGVSTRRNFTYTGADAAEPAMYRVKAQRGDTNSSYSNTAAIGI